MCVINLQESHCGISRYIFQHLTSADVHDVHLVGSQQLIEILKQSCKQADWGTVGVGLRITDANTISWGNNEGLWGGGWGGRDIQKFIS